jgi:hypothetical protein
MTKRSNTPPADPNRRIVAVEGHPLVGLPVRIEDIEPTQGLHWIALLCRVMSGMLVLLMLVQIVTGVTSAIPLSWGVLAAEVIRLIIFAGLLWGAGDLADLFVKSHCDVRAMRILLERLNHTATSQMPPPGRPHLDRDDTDFGRGDTPH